MKSYFLPVFLLFSHSWTHETESDYTSIDESQNELGEVLEGYELDETESEEELTYIQTEDGFIILDPSVAQTDIKIVGILNVAVQLVTKQAIANGSLYDSPYELDGVFSVQQNIANPDQYRFDVGVRNYLRNTVVMDFVLVYDEPSNTIDIISWGFPNLILPVKGVEIVPGGMDQIPANYREIDFDLNDTSSFVYNIGYAALQIVAATGFLEGTIPGSYYVAKNVNNVWVKFEGGKLYYRFDLDAADEYGNSARFMYIVSYDTATSMPHLEEMHIANVVNVS